MENDDDRIIIITMITMVVDVIIMMIMIIYMKPSCRIMFRFSGGFIALVKS